MNVGKFVNSPIVVAIVVIASAFVLVNSAKPTGAQEIRGVYDELTKIMEESSEGEKKLVVQNFITELGSQISEGFSAAFEGSKEEEKQKLRELLDTKKKLRIADVKRIQSQWPGRENYIFTIKNESERIVGNLKLNYRFQNGDVLVDAENKWINEIQALEPNEEVALKVDRTLPKEASEKVSSNQLTVSVISLEIKNI